MEAAWTLSDVSSISSVGVLGTLSLRWWASLCAYIFLEGSFFFLRDKRRTNLIVRNVLILRQNPSSFNIHLTSRTCPWNNREVCPFSSASWRSVRHLKIAPMSPLRFLLHKPSNLGCSELFSSVTGLRLPTVLLPSSENPGALSMPHLKHGAPTEHSIPRDISATLFHWSGLWAWIWKAWACFSPTAAMSQFASFQLKRPGIIVTQPVVKLALASSSVQLIFFHWDTELSDFPGSVSPSFSTHPLSWSWSCHPVCHELFSSFSLSLTGQFLQLCHFYLLVFALWSTALHYHVLLKLLDLHRYLFS